MTPVIQIKFEVPEGTAIQVLGLDGAQVEAVSVVNPVERYFTEYLSDNGRKVFSAATKIEDYRGKPGFTLDDLAEHLGVRYESVKSWHRTIGRSAKRWRRETASQEPIRFEWIDYVEFEEGVGERTVYRLPEDVADIIRPLPIVQPPRR